MTSFHVLSVFHPNTIFSDTVCIFTDHSRATKEKNVLQDAIDATWAKAARDAPNPIVDLTSFDKDDMDKIHPNYLDRVENQLLKNPLASIPSSGQGCWFDYLKSEEKHYHETTEHTDMYVVTDFLNMCPDDKFHHKDSQVVGVFRNPAKAYEVQQKILQGYKVIDTCWPSSFTQYHFVELQGFVGGKGVDPQVVEYRYVRHC